MIRTRLLPTADGFARKCESCHTGKFAKPVKIAPMQNLPCIACHMPYADPRCV